MSPASEMALCYSSLSWRFPGLQASGSRPGCTTDSPGESPTLPTPRLLSRLIVAEFWEGGREIIILTPPPPGDSNALEGSKILPP